MSAQTDKVLNIIRGKNLVGKTDKADVLKLFEHIDAMEELLNIADGDDMFGTEGWRHRLGVDE